MIDLLRFLYLWRFRTTKQIHRNIAREAKECHRLLIEIKDKLQSLNGG